MSMLQGFVIKPLASNISGQSSSPLLLHLARTHYPTHYSTHCLTAHLSRVRLGDCDSTPLTSRPTPSPSQDFLSSTSQTGHSHVTLFGSRPCPLNKILFLPNQIKPQQRSVRLNKSLIFPSPVSFPILIFLYREPQDASFHSSFARLKIPMLLSYTALAVSKP